MNGRKMRLYVLLVLCLLGSLAPGYAYADDNDDESDGFRDDDNDGVPDDEDHDHDGDGIPDAELYEDRHAPQYEHETDLHRKLFHHYDKQIIPRTDPKKALNVSFGVTLVDIIKLDHYTNTLHTTLWLKQSWTDARLAWDPKDFGGTKILRVNPNDLWRPDVTLYNNVRAPAAMLEPSLAVVYSSGFVLWIPPFHYDSRCSGEHSGDHVHTCTFKFGSWTFDGYTLDIDFFDKLAKFDVSDFEPGTWSVAENTAKKNVKFYPCCKEPYPNLEFTLKIKKAGGKRRWH